MKMKRVSAGLCAFAMTLSSVYSVMPAVADDVGKEDNDVSSYGSAEQGDSDEPDTTGNDDENNDYVDDMGSDTYDGGEISLGDDDEGDSEEDPFADYEQTDLFYYKENEWVFKDPVKLLSDEDAVFVVSYENYDSNWKSVGFGMSEGDQWKFKGYALKYGNELELRIYVKDILDTIEVDGDAVGVADVNDVVYAKIESYNSASIHEIKYLTGDEAAELPDVDSEYDISDPYSVFYDSENVLNVDYTDFKGTGSLYAQLEYDGFTYTAEIPKDPDNNWQTSVNIGDLLSKLTAEDEEAAVPTIDPYNADRIYSAKLIGSGGASVTGYDVDWANPVLGDLRKDMGWTFPMNLFNDKKNELVISYNGKEEGEGIDFAIRDDFGNWYHAYLDVEQNESGELHISAGDLEDKLYYLEDGDKVPMSEKLESYGFVSSCYIYGINGSRIWDVYCINAAEIYGTEHYYFSTDESGFLDDPENTFTITYTDENDGWGDIGISFYDNDVYKTAVITNPAAEKGDIVVSVAEILKNLVTYDDDNNAVPAEYDGTYVSDFEIFGYNGCRIFSVKDNYAHYKLGYIKYNMGDLSSFFSAEDNILNVTYTGAEEGGELTFHIKDDDGNEYTASYKTEGAEGALRLSSKDIYDSLTYVPEGETEPVGIEIPAYQLGNVYIKGDGVRVKDTDIYSSPFAGETGCWIDTDEFRKFLSNPENKMIFSYNDVHEGWGDIVVGFYDYNDGEWKQSVITTSEGTLNNITITAAELLELLTKQEYNEESGENEWVPSEVTNVDNIEEPRINSYNGCTIISMSYALSDRAYFDYEVNEDEDDPYIVITGYNGSDADVVIPEEIDGIPVREIGTDAFNSKNYITSITLPDSLEGINYDAFFNCKALQTVTLGRRISWMGSSVFNGCASLKTIIVPEDNDRYMFVDGGFYSTATDYINDEPEPKHCDRLLFVTPGTEELVIPDGVTEISNNAASGLRDLKNVYIPASVRRINRYAFSNCISLSEVTFEDDSTITDVYKNSFDNTPWYDALKANSELVIIGSVLLDGTNASGEVTVPDGITTIGSEAFYDAKNITEVILPTTVITIDENAFYNCGLSHLTVPASVMFIGDRAIGYREYYNEDWEMYDSTRNEDFVIYLYKNTEAESYAQNYDINYKYLEMERIDQSLELVDGRLAIALHDYVNKRNNTITNGVLRDTDYYAGDVYGYKINFTADDDYKERYADSRVSMCIGIGRENDYSSITWSFTNYSGLLNDWDCYKAKSDGSITYTVRVSSPVFNDIEDDYESSAYIFFGNSTNSSDKIDTDGLTINSVVLYDKKGNVITVLGEDITKDEEEAPVKLTDPSQIKNITDLNEYLGNLGYDEAVKYLETTYPGIYLRKGEETYVIGYDDDDEEITEIHKFINIYYNGSSFHSVYDENGELTEQYFELYYIRLEDGIYYTIDKENNYAVICGVDKDGEIVIPDELEGYPVKKLGYLRSVTGIAFDETGSEVVGSFGDAVIDFRLIGSEEGKDYVITLPDNMTVFGEEYETPDGIYHHLPVYVDEGSTLTFVYSKDSAAEKFFDEYGEKYFGSNNRISWRAKEETDEPECEINLVTKSGETLSGITVTATDINGYEYDVPVDENGGFSLASLPDGDYTIAVRKEGFSTRKYDVTVGGDEAVSLDVELYINGDADGDGARGLNDLLVMQKALAGWNVKIDRSVADVTGDDQLRLDDLTTMQKSLAGWNVQLKTT